MQVFKKVEGHLIKLELVLAKTYPRFSLYNVIRNGKVLYQTTLTDKELEKIIINNYEITEEDTFNEWNTKKIQCY